MACGDALVSISSFIQDFSFQLCSSSLVDLQVPSFFNETVVTSMFEYLNWVVCQKTHGLLFVNVYVLELELMFS